MLAQITCTPRIKKKGNLKFKFNYLQIFKKKRNLNVSTTYLHTKKIKKKFNRITCAPQKKSLIELPAYPPQKKKNFYDNTNYLHSPK